MKRRDFLQLLGLGTVAASCGPCRSIVEAKPKPPPAPPEMLDTFPASFRGVEFLVERDLTEAFAREEDRLFLSSPIVDLPPDARYVRLVMTTTGDSSPTYRWEKAG